MGPLKVFIISSEEDIAYRNELLKFLRHLEIRDKIKIWTDLQIKPGELWDDSIKLNLQEADIVLMLISVDFYNSNYIQNVEFDAAKQRLDRGEILLIPILAKQCPWEDYDLINSLKAMPTNGVPIEKWSSSNDAYTHIAKAFEDSVDRLRSSRLEKERKILELKRIQLEKEARNMEERAKQEKRAREQAEQYYQEEIAKVQAEGQYQIEGLQAESNAKSNKIRKTRLTSIVIGVLLCLSTVLAVVNYNKNKELEKANTQQTAMIGGTASRQTQQEDENTRLKEELKNDRQQLLDLQKNIFMTAYDYYQEEESRYPNRTEEANMSRANQFLKKLGFEEKDLPADLDTIIQNPSKAN